jgi:alpha-tubulin suppressor-like RCC1 family protein
MNESVSAWGDNSNGQLGDESTAGRNIPAPVQGLAGVRKVEAGSGHVVALLDDGTAVAWGRNAFGQVGDGSTTNPLLPAPVKGLTGIKDIVPGGGQTLFVLEDGTVWGCGAGFFGLLGPTNLRIHPVPVKVEGVSGVTDLVSGGGHALALLDDGSVWSWGRDDYGQLGDGPEPAGVAGRAVQEHAGHTYPCRPVPTRVAGLSGIRALAAGGGHSAAVLDDGSMLSWGDNDRGQLGDGTTIHRPSPGKVENLSGVIAAACAYHHTLAVREDGTLWAFGINDRGQLGDGTTTHRSQPVQVKGLSGVHAVSPAGGGGEAAPGNYGHNLALLEDGTLRSWGCNDHGELGDGTTQDRLVPSPVAHLAGVRHITTGGEVPVSRENPGGGFCLAIHSSGRS